MDNEYQQLKDKYNSSEFDYQIEPIKEAKASTHFWEALLNLISQIKWEYILYAIVAFAILIVLYTMYRRGFFVTINHNQKIDPQVEHFKSLEDNLLETNLEQLIDQAIEVRDFRVAIRYHHYLNTQNLAKNGYITWDPKKTNVQLISTIKKANIQEQFRENTQIFNQVWFGNFQLTEAQFKDFDAKFQHFNQSL